MKRSNSLREIIAPSETLILIHKFLNNLFLLILKGRLHVRDSLKINALLSVYFAYPLYLLGSHLVSKRLVYNDEDETWGKKPTTTRKSLNVNCYRDNCTFNPFRVDVFQRLLPQVPPVAIISLRSLLRFTFYPFRVIITFTIASTKAIHILPLRSKD